MMKLSQNQIEATTTIVTKQRDGLLKFAEEDGRARDAATILSTALVVLASDFYPAEGEVAVNESAPTPPEVDPDDLPFE